MIRLDQLVYTACMTSKKRGYQVISQSEGISKDVILSMNLYFLPAGIGLGEFKSSKSMRILPCGKVAYSNIKNVGVGFDGRPDTLYNHTVVMSVEDFAKIGYDSTLLNLFYLEHAVPGDLPTIDMEESISLLSIEDFKEARPLVRQFLGYLFSKTRILISGTDDERTIQCLLKTAPPSARLVSFSTFVRDPRQRSGYDVILDAGTGKNLSSKQYRVLPLEPCLTYEDQDEFDEMLDYLVGMFDMESRQQIEQVYSGFEEMVGTDMRTRIIALICMSKMEVSHNVEDLHRLTLIITKQIKQFESNVAYKLTKRLRDCVDKETYINYMAPIEIGWVEENMPKYQVTIESIEKIFDGLSYKDTESMQCLLDGFYRIKKDEFHNSAFSILEKCGEFYFDQELCRFFVSNKGLHDELIRFLVGTANHHAKTTLFETVIPITTEDNPEFLIELMMNHPYNMTNVCEVVKFQDMLKLVFNSKKIIHDHSKILFAVINDSIDLIRKAIQDQKFYGILIPNPVVIQLHQTTKLLLDTLEEITSKENMQNVNRLRSDVNDMLDDTRPVEWMLWFLRDWYKPSTV